MIRPISGEESGMCVHLRLRLKASQRTRIASVRHNIELYRGFAMNISGNTILITGGTSGIGFELAAELLKLRNTVIITGRDPRRLEETQRKLPGVQTFQSDVSDPKAIPVLFEAVIKKFPALNVLINNAGIMRKINLRDRKTETGNGAEN